MGMISDNNKNELIDSSGQYIIMSINKICMGIQT